MKRKSILLLGIAIELVLLTVFLWNGYGKEESRQTYAFGERADTRLLSQNEKKGSKEYIKWVDFQVTCEAMKQAYAYDAETYGREVHLGWVELLAYLGARYGGDFSDYKASHMEEAAQRLLKKETTMEELTGDMEYYPYYREAYGAVLDGLVGVYEIEEKGDVGEAKTASWVKKYGLKGFSPIAKGFPYSDYDDFGVSRSYGYRRNHLGHDMMGQVGTPIVAVESGVIRILGWNQYGGWRMGIDSFDKKRYYYYAHLRQNFPFAKRWKEGDIVQAGDVIGYMGRTGYSTKENVNNIDCYHLHFGLQLIFDESQREGNQEIWVNPYELVKFLYGNRSETLRDDSTKEWERIYRMKDSQAEAYAKAIKQKK